MNVNFVDFERVNVDFFDVAMMGITDVIARSSFVCGPQLAKFEKEFADYCEREYAVGVGSGTAALRLALQAHGIDSGEVITVPTTFFATAAAIAQVGATPRFVDVNTDDFNMDPSKLEEAINRDTRAIIPVHLTGQPSDMAPIAEIAERHGLFIIEDCAQAHGAKYSGQVVPVIGTGCFSFYPSKNLGSFGDGGAVVTDDSEVNERLKILRNIGCSEKYVHTIVAGNDRLHTMQAPVLSAKLPHLDRWNQLRREHAGKYTQLLENVVDTPAVHDFAEHVFHLYVIQANNRNELQTHLGKQGVSSVIHYPIPVHLQKAFSYLGHKRGDFPVAESIADRVLSLPMFPGMRDEEIKYVADSVKSFYGK